MAYQITTKPIGLIKDLRMYIHGIPYIATFTILHNNVVYSSYSMLFGKPWRIDAKVAHDWGNNMITIQRNGIVQTITMTKHLGTNMKKTQVLTML